MFAYCQPMDRCHYFGMLSVCLLLADGPQPLFWDAQCLLILTWQAALHEMRIDLLETRLDNLTLVVQTLADKFDTFAEQVSLPHYLHGTKDRITISSDLGGGGEGGQSLHLWKRQGHLLFIVTLGGGGGGNSVSVVGVQTWSSL